MADPNRAIVGVADFLGVPVTPEKVMVSNRDSAHPLSVSKFDDPELTLVAGYRNFDQSGIAAGE